MRLCVHCRHFSPCAPLSNDGLCLADKPERVAIESKVTGKMVWRWEFATTMRGDDEGKCGPQGKWWEPK